MAITIIHADGTIEQKEREGEPTLQELQQMVGGLIEVHHVGPHKLWGDEPGQLLLNEEGRIHALPANEVFRKQFMADFRGTVVVLTGDNVMR